MEQNKKIYDHILKYTGLLGGVQVFYILMSVLRNKFTAYFIGPWGMGLVMVYSKAAEFMGNITNFGLGFSAVRELAAYHERGERQAEEQCVKMVRSWTFIAAVLGFVVCVVLAPFLSRSLLGDYHSTKGFLMLSPMVPMLTLLGGELAILKGLRLLKRMAAMSAVGAFCTMVLSAVIYWLLGVHGVLPVLLTTTATTLLLNLYATTREYPYRLGLRSTKLLRRGGKMIALGSAFLLAGVFGSGADVIITGFLSRSASPHALGLYAAGFTLVVAYARMVFVAMDADYFPRLSGAGEDVEQRNFIINKQIDVLVLLMGPFLIAFTLCLPLIVRLLYTEEFMLAVPMAVCAVSLMFFKAVYSPVSYLALARGTSMLYLAMELLYDVVFVLCVVVGFKMRGLVGAGLGLSLANLFDLLLISTVYHFKFGFRYERSTLRRSAMQYLLLVAGLLAAIQESAWAKWSLGLAALALSCWLSWHLLRRETSVVEKWKGLTRKFRKQ